MSATTEPSSTTLHLTRSREHPECVVCSPDHPQGLRVRFEALPDGSTRGSFDCQKSFEGFPGIIHGGVLSALADCAMLHCLFARGQSALTVELSVQFRHPVRVGQRATVQARLVEQSRSLYTLTADIVQGGQVKVRAMGRFFGDRLGRNAGGNADGNGDDYNPH